METPVTVEFVESVQEEIEESVDGTEEWEVSIADPYDATTEGEFSVVNLYKNGANDGQVNVLVMENGEFELYEYFDSSTVKVADSIEDLVVYLNQVIENK